MFERLGGELLIVEDVKKEEIGVPDEQKSKIKYPNLLLSVIRKDTASTILCQFQGLIIGHDPIRQN